MFDEKWFDLIMIITMMLDLIKIRFWGGGSFSTG
jgi:hypothetical protein